MANKTIGQLTNAAARSVTLDKQKTIVPIFQATSTENLTSGVTYNANFEQIIDDFKLVQNKGDINLKAGSTVSNYDSNLILEDSSATLSITDSQTSDDISKIRVDDTGISISGSTVSINGLINPSSDTDAANKIYVDTNLNKIKTSTNVWQGRIQKRFGYSPIRGISTAITVVIEKGKIYTLCDYHWDKIIVNSITNVSKSKTYNLGVSAFTYNETGEFAGLYTSNSITIAMDFIEMNSDDQYSIDFLVLENGDWVAPSGVGTYQMAFYWDMYTLTYGPLIKNQVLPFATTTSVGGIKVGEGDFSISGLTGTLHIDNDRIFLSPNDDSLIDTSNLLLYKYGKLRILTGYFELVDSIAGASPIFSIPICTIPTDSKPSKGTAVNVRFNRGVSQLFPGLISGVTGIFSINLSKNQPTINYSTTDNANIFNVNAVWFVE